MVIYGNACKMGILLLFIELVELKRRIGRQAGDDIDLIGVRIDTADAIVDYE
jgi:hypothetical protein